MLGDFKAVRPQNWDEIIDDHHDNENNMDRGVQRGERSRAGSGNGNDNGEGERDTQGSQKGTGIGKCAKPGKGKAKANKYRKGK